MVSHSIVWSVLAWSGVAWADDRELHALELGDFDCSGQLDEARLYRDVDGLAQVEVALDVPEAEQGEPQSSTLEGASLAVSDLDDDGCGDLLVTVDKLTKAFTSTDGEWRPEEVLGGAGDWDPDVGIYKTRDGGGVDDIIAIFKLGEISCIRICYLWVHNVSQDWRDPAVCGEWVHECKDWNMPRF